MTRKYSSTSVATTLAAGVNSSALSITVAAGTGVALMGGVTLGAGNVDSFALALDFDTINEEIVWVTGISGDILTIIRAEAGTTAIAHTAGASVKHVFTGDDATFFTAGVATADAAIPETVVTAKGDLLVGQTASTVDNLAVGTNGQVLVADSAQTLGVKWATDPTADVVTTAGDLIYGTAADTVTRLGIGTAGQSLLVNSGATAPEWGNPLSITLNAQTGTTYSLLASDLNKLVTLSNASAITLTITNGVFTAGQQINVQQIGAGQVTIQGDGTTVLTSTGATATAPKLRAQYSAATIVCTSSNNFTVIGDLS
jgi:hypothetical protein